MRKLEFAAAWRETFASARADWSLYGTLAAAFVLLPTMVVAVLGPAEPRTFGEVNGSQLLAQFVVMVIGGIAQLAIIALASGTAPDARAALRRAVSALPALIAILILTAVPLVPAVLLLKAAQTGYPGLLLPGLIVLVPGLYAVARLALAVPVLATTKRGAVAALRVSWAATMGNGWRVLGFLLAIIALLLFAMLLAGGLAAAFASVLTLVGAPGIGRFVVALISAAIASGYTVVNSIGLAILLKRLG